MKNIAVIPSEYPPIVPYTNLTEAQASAWLNVKIKTLQAWRTRGGGPRFIKLGRCVRYRVEDLTAYVEKRVRTSTSDEGLKL